MNEKGSLFPEVTSVDAVRSVTDVVWIMENKEKGLGDVRGVQAFDGCKYGCRYWEDDFLGCPDHDPRVSHE